MGPRSCVQGRAGPDAGKKGASPGGQRCKTAPGFAPVSKSAPGFDCSLGGTSSCWRWGGEGRGYAGPGGSGLCWTGLVGHLGTGFTGAALRRAERLPGAPSTSAPRAVRAGVTARIALPGWVG